MTRVVIQQPRDDAKTLVMASLEQVDAIDAYADEGQRLVGKQAASVFGGNGARLVVEIPELQGDPHRTVLEVSAEKEVPMDMATDASAIEADLLDVLNELRGRDPDAVLAEMSQQMRPADSKEVASLEGVGDVESAMGKRFVVTFLVLLVGTLLFGLLMTAMLMP